jgi:hypothetical protein
MNGAGALGAFCQIELLHGCLAARGPRRPEARMVTLARAGTLEGAAALIEALRAPSTFELGSASASSAP